MNILQKKKNNLLILKKCMYVRFYISNIIICNLFNKFPNLLNDIMVFISFNKINNNMECNNILYSENIDILLPSNLLDD
jgi:hypothetical protein